MIKRREMLKLLGLSLCSLCSLSLPGNAHALAALIKPKSDLKETQVSRVMFGNILVSLTALSSDQKKARQAISDAFLEMKRLEHLMSMFRKESQLSRINQAAGLRPVKVDREILEVLDLGLQLSRETEGAFNMAIGSAMRHWDFIDKKRIPTEEEIQALSRATRFEDVMLDKAGEMVFLKKKGMQIDPGGIGKGYIAERAKTILLESGITSGLIALAGDLVLFGTKADGSSWRVGVQHPRRKGEIVASLDLTDCAISTSGDYERFFRKDGVTYHHLLDPKTLFPARRCQSVSVVSEKGSYADSMATGAFVMGPEKGMQFLNRSEHGEGIIIDGAGEITVSPKLASRIRFH